MGNIMFVRKYRYEEDRVQIAVINYLKLNRFLFTSTGAGLVKSQKTQILMNRLGYTAGSPDIIVFIPNGTIGIEVKKPATYRYSDKTKKMIVDIPAGVQSEDQKIFQKKLTNISGHFYIVAKSVGEVIDFFSENGINPI